MEIERKILIFSVCCQLYNIVCNIILLMKKNKYPSFFELTKEVAVTDFLKFLQQNALSNSHALTPFNCKKEDFFLKTYVLMNFLRLINFYINMILYCLTCALIFRDTCYVGKKGCHRLFRWSFFVHFE